MLSLHKYPITKNRSNKYVFSRMPEPAILRKNLEKKCPMQTAISKRTEKKITAGFCNLIVLIICHSVKTIVPVCTHPPEAGKNVWKKVS